VQPLKIPKVFIDALTNLLLCSLIGAAIFLFGWSPELWISLVISYVFGFSSFIVTLILTSLFPSRSSLFRLTVPWLIALLVGSVFAYFLLDYLGMINQAGLVKFGKIVLLAFCFGSVIVYFFYNQQHKLTLQEALKEVELKQAEKEKDLLQSQLRLLQAQIEPHFLFNTLANLKSLIQQDSERANLLLDKLTELLRLSLKSTRQDQFTLAEELDFCQSYLSIQAIRLGERLSFNFVIAENVDLRQDFPALLLQPLVENAVLHGIEPSEIGGSISVAVKLVESSKAEESGRLVIDVMDTGLGLEQSHISGHGIGLSNVRKRLKSLYGERGHFQIVDNASGGVSSHIEIPNNELQIDDF